MTRQRPAVGEPGTIQIGGESRSNAQLTALPWPDRPRQYGADECGLRGDPFDVDDVRVQLVVGDVRHSLGGRSERWARWFPRYRSERAA